MASLAFPSNPTDLQQHTTNGKIYIFKSSYGAWLLLTAQDSQQKLATEKKSIAFSVALS